MATERAAIELEESVGWFTTADQVCFLGFGFDTQNIQRLGIGDAMNARFTRSPAGDIQGKALRVYATVMGIPNPRIEQIRLQLLKLPNPGTAWDGANNEIVRILPEWNCLQ